MRILFNIFLILLTLAVLIWVVWQGFLLISSGGQYLEASQRAILAGAALIAVVCTFMVSHAIRQSGSCAGGDRWHALSTGSWVNTAGLRG